MKTIFYLCVLVFAINDIDPTKIAKINKLKEEAETAYNNKSFNVAISRYKQLEELGVKEDPMLLNLAHSYFQTKDLKNALSYYSNLVLSNDPYIKSVANQQIGVMKANEKDYESALKFFKEALRASPQNEAARHNYELTKKLLEQKKKQQEQQNKDKNQDKQKKEEEEKKKQEQQQQQKQEQKQNEQGDKKENADKKEQEGKDDKKEEKKEGQKDEQSEKKGKEEEKESNEKRTQRLQQMNLTEEQAKTILDAMKSNEVQYLQQNKKKPTKKQDKGRPDW